MRAVALLFRKSVISPALRFVMPSMFNCRRVSCNTLKAPPADIERIAASYTRSTYSRSISSSKIFFQISSLIASVTREASNSTVGIVCIGSAVSVLLWPRRFRVSKNFEAADIKPQHWNTVSQDARGSVVDHEGKGDVVRYVGHRLLLWLMGFTRPRAKPLEGAADSFLH